VLSGNTSVNGRLAFLQQHFGVAPQFDFGGTSGALMVTWRATGKTSVTAGWQRSLTSYQTAGTTHTQTDSYTAGPAWQISPKTSLRLQYSYAVRDDQGNPTGVPTSRQDRTQDTSLSYSWQPHPLATLSATVGDSVRSSNVANADYTARQLTLAAQFSF
jgi:Putative beta-barrel porin 2